MSDFEKVKSALDIQEVITGATGYQMQRHHLEQCPFCHGHECFSINRDKGFFKCFQCPDQNGGDVITFLKAFYGFDDRGALEKGAELAGVTLEKRAGPGLKLSSVDKIMAEAADYYHRCMLNNGAANYLTGERGHRMETLKTLRVGYSDGNLLGYLRHKKFSDDDILKSGMARKKTVGDTEQIFDFFGRDLVVYPHTANGRVMHFTMKDPKKERAYQLNADKRNKQWMFYNQDAIARHDEIILVEGENDLQSVMDAGYYNVIAQIGQTSDVQIKALNASFRKKRLILWLDNDEPNPETGKRAGHEYIRKICRAMKGLDVRVVLYPDDCDPDEYLQGFKGDRRKEIKRLVGEAVDYVSWEIHQAGRLPDLESRLKALKENEVFSAVAMATDTNRQVYAEKLLGLGFSKEAIAEQIEDRMDIRRKLNLYYETLGDKSKADPNVVAGIVFKGFSRDGRFFFDRANKVYLLYGQRILEIGSNRPFNALMKKHSLLLPTKEPGRSVWESLASEGYNSGNLIEVENWISTNDKTDTIFLNMNSPNNTIIKVGKRRIDEIPNGINDDQILLKSSDLMRPFTYLPDADMAKGFGELRRLVFGNLTCEPEQRYLVLCWLISGFMFDFTESQALMKFAGASASGKSTGASLLTMLLYGAKQVGAPSAAAAFSEASQNPLLVIDNLETEDITKGMKNFLLLSASKNAKTKRTSGTESGTTKETPKSLVLITAIEPFPKSEMINRTIEIDFSKKFKSDEFIENDAVRELAKNRDLILSCILKLVAKKVLPSLDRRRAFMSVLQKEYRGHSKDRLNDHLSLMMLILDCLLPYLPYYQADDFLAGIESGEQEIRKKWIEYQDTKAKETEVGSNDIVRLLDGLVREYKLSMASAGLTPDYKYGFDGEVFCYRHPDYGLEMVKTVPVVKEDDDGEPYALTFFEFEATSADIVPALSLYCKNYGLRNPYPSTAVFGSRLKNDLSTLRKAGWELVTKNGSELYSRRVKGQRFFRFRKRMIALSMTG